MNRKNRKRQCKKKFRWCNEEIIITKIKWSIFVFIVVQYESIISRTFVFAYPLITCLSTGQGLSNNEVKCILQDHKGFMWFGTLDGLNRYDGYAFKVF